MGNNLKLRDTLFSLLEEKQEAVFLLTRRCNNNCSHCYINLPSNAKTKELSVALWCKIIDQLVANNFTFLLLTGGEPTLYSGFKEVYMYAKRKGLLLRIMTNATNLDEATKTMFEKYPPYEIIATIYGVNEKMYGTVTNNKEGWQPFLRNLSFLEKLEKTKGTIFKLTSILTKDTINFQEEINALSLKYTGKMPEYTKTLFSRFDKDPVRNKLILEKKISKEELKKVAFDLVSSVKNEEKKTYPELFYWQRGKKPRIAFYEDGTMSYNNLIIDERYTLKPTEEELENFNLEKMEQKLAEKFSLLESRKINEKCGTCLLRKYCLSCPEINLLNEIPIDGYDEETCLQELLK